MQQEKDNMREICIQQGYVPSTCTLDGMIIWGLVNKGECPCSGCNANRDICNGKRKEYVNYTNDDKLFSFLDKWDEIERKQREEQRKRNEEIIRQRKEGHIDGYTRTLLEIRWEIACREPYIECIVKDIVDEKAYHMKVKYINEIINILPYICKKYKVEQIHVEDDNIGACIYDEIVGLKLENIDIVPLKFVRLKLE